MKFEELKSTYEALFQQCKINDDKIDFVNDTVDRILAHEEKYRLAQNKSGVPWSVIAAIHSLEASLNFNTHLHNGDPLSQKTTHVPKGRPPGNPPFTWEFSAADALQNNGVTIWQEWTIPGALFVLERYNGAGYNKRKLNSPYLWSFSNNYTKGKFVEDGKFDADAVSKQCGAALLLKTLIDRNIDTGLIVSSVVPVSHLPVTFEALPETDEKPKYPGRILKVGENDLFIVRPLQLRLSELGCGDLKGSGFFGNNTEAAVKLFQARFTDVDGRPLKIDGEVGSLTWAALFGADTVPKQDEAGSKLLKKVLEIAVSQIGVMEHPLGSNRGTEVEKYLKSVGLGGGNAWCAAFTYWCFEQAAQKLKINDPAVKTGGVLNHWAVATRQNLPHITNEQAKNNPALVIPGMVFIIDTGGGAGHTGFVEKVNGGRLVTIEGNTNDGGSREGIGVFRREARKIADINKGFIDYSSF